MPDPFEVLRTPVVPVDPSPEFARRLRARLEQALDPRRDVPMPTRDPGPEVPPLADAPGSRPGDIAYVSLWVPDIERAAAFFGTVLGWRYAPGGDTQGRQVEGVTPRHGLWGGQARSTLFMCFAVDDVHAAVERARRAGGRIEEPTQEHYGLVADGADDQDVRFALVESPAGPDADRPPTGSNHGDLAYVSMLVRDSARARAFYGSVLGWRFTPGHAADGWQADDVVPMVGLAGGAETPTLVPMYRVEDIAAAVERVRGAGGEATAPERQPYGVTSSCTDDQGTSFHLGQL